MTAAVAGLMERMARLGLPARPAGPIVEQEAVIARLERTWGRELDAVRNPDEGCEVLIGALREAVLNDDPLIVWAIASDRTFARSYFRSRGWGDHLGQFEAEVGRVLDGAARGEAQSAREILGWLEGPNGLANVVQVAHAALTNAFVELGVVGRPS